jgi:hypothetical protein
MCDRDGKAKFSPASDQGHNSLLFQSVSDAAASAVPTDGVKYTNAFAADGVGDIHPLSTSTLVVDALSDEAGDGIGVAPGNPVIAVGAPSYIGVLNTLGDQDFFKVTLEAGKTYEIGMYSYAGPDAKSGTPLFDPYVILYGANGKEIVTADGGAHTVRNDANSGLDVLLTFEPTKSGTYYINARAFDNFGGTPTGDSVGDYELFVREQDPNDPNNYNPYYDPNSPLYSIDWGTQVDGTARNPDGNEGIRPTGNPQGAADPKGETVGHFGESTEGKNVIKIYFAKPGDVYGSSDPANPNIPPAAVAVGAKDYEVQAIWTALHEFEKVADVIYVETQNRDEADFHYVTYTGTPGPGISLLGAMNPPQEADEGLALFNSGDERWDELNLQQGGFSFVTLIHEFGHGHGLAHPHDSGGHSGEMREVEGVIDTPAGEVPDPSGVYPNYTLGQYDLNQAVYTMMSYMDGWQKAPHGNAPTDVGYGYLGSLMAFDIAVIQDKYGVNEDTAKGDDTYVLKNINAPGTFYSSIWDTGGTDSIVYDGGRSATIDLRPATLKYEEGGGGWVSYARGIYGGFTIANGVVIENATSGNGNDTLIGNGAANVLSAGKGKDTLIGGRGNDALDGGENADSMQGGTGNDTYFVENIYDKVVEKAFNGVDTVRSTISYTLPANVENLILEGASGIDGEGNALVNRITGNDGDNWLTGNQGNDTLIGGDGDDHLWGNEGRDLIRGGDGKDIFHITETGVANLDKILDFDAADDKIMLARYAFKGFGSATEVAPGAFHVGTAAQDASDRILYDQASGKLFYDADGTGAAAAVIFATVTAGMPLTYANFDIYG